MGVAGEEAVEEALGQSCEVEICVENADLDDRMYLLNLFLLPFELVQRVYGQAGNQPTVQTASLVAALVAWVAASA